VRVQKEYALLAQSGLIAKSGARIHPQPACLGPTTAGVEHRDRRIVGEELGGGEPGMQRLQPSTGVADGGGKRWRREQSGAMPTFNLIRRSLPASFP